MNHSDSGLPITFIRQPIDLYAMENIPVEEQTAAEIDLNVTSHVSVSPTCTTPCSIGALALVTNHAVLPFDDGTATTQSAALN
jgi:hypothetical protein